jgi:hypothetical protein
MVHDVDFGETLTLLLTTRARNFLGLYSLPLMCFWQERIKKWKKK